MVLFLLPVSTKLCHSVNSEPGGCFVLTERLKPENFKTGEEKLICVQTFQSFVRNYCLSVFILIFSSGEDNPRW